MPQARSWTNDDPDLWRHIALLGNNVLNKANANPLLVTYYHKICYGSTYLLIFCQWCIRSITLDQYHIREYQVTDFHHL